MTDSKRSERKEEHLQTKAKSYHKRRKNTEADRIFQESNRKPS